MIDWTKQHCGVYQAPFAGVKELMPDVASLIGETFPGHEFLADFTYDVKVHMLMPGQYACIPGWHVDNVPRDEHLREQFDKVQLEKPMYLWLSGPPLTEFEDGRKILPWTWTRFTQADRHRGTVSEAFQWRCFIRATHVDIMRPAPPAKWPRRHCQVYLDAERFKW